LKAEELEEELRSSTKEEEEDALDLKTEIDTDYL
jgi:hypothetical protein